MIKKRVQGWLLGLSGLLSFIFSMAGFYISGETDLYVDLLRSLDLLSGCLDVYKNSNVFIEIGRWLGFIFTAGVIVSVFNFIYSFIAIRIKVMMRNSYAIHGNSEFCSTLQKTLGKNVICSDKKIAMKAKNQVILFTKDEEALDFLESRKDDLSKSAHIHIGFESIRRETICQQITYGKKINISLFNMAENCARLYWQNYWEKADCKNAKITMIGEGSYGEHLLTQALLVNIFAPNQEMEYHMFGNYDKYQALHKHLFSIEFDENKNVSIARLKETQDKVYFHHSPWYRDTDDILDSDRIVLCGLSSDNLKLAGDLLSMFANVPSLDIRVDSEHMVDSLFAGNNISTFGTAKQLCDRKLIIGNELLKQAMKIDARYFRQYNNESMCQNCDKELSTCTKCNLFLNRWENNLSTHLKYHNIAVADHAIVKLKLLHMTEDEIQKCDDVFEKITIAQKDTLQEVEHIRWNRYYYMYNWTLNEHRDDHKRQHRLLKAYSELPAEEKIKDKSNYDILKALYDKNDDTKRR